MAAPEPKDDQLEEIDQNPQIEAKDDAAQEKKSVITFSSSVKASEDSKSAWTEESDRNDAETDNDSASYDHQYSKNEKEDNQRFASQEEEDEARRDQEQDERKANRLPNFQSSYGGGRVIDETGRAIIWEDRDRNHNTRLSLDQNKGTVHHYPAQERLPGDGKRQEQQRYPDDGKSQEKFNVLTHAERDPMLTEPFSAAQKPISTAGFNKVPFMVSNEEFNVKYEDNTDPASNRQEIEQQNLLMKATLADASTTYTTLISVPQSSTSYANLYQNPEYTEQYQNKPQGKNFEILETLNQRLLFIRWE